MNIVFLTDYLDRFIQPLCEALYLRLGEHFRLVASLDPDRDCSDEIRLRRGVIRSAPYLTGLGQGESLIKAADAVILGSASDSLIADRVSGGQFTIRCADRLLEGGLRELFDPFMLYPHWLRHTRFRNRQFFLLCQSMRAAKDARLLLSYPGKRFRWGIFPRISGSEIMAARDQRADPDAVPTILWTGSLTGHGHPETAVEAASQLADDGFDFNMKLIGCGELESSLAFDIRERRLGSRVTLLGGMSAEAVRINLEQSDILLYTADEHEGWGIPVAEGMASGCAVVSSDGSGAASFMIEHEKNGMIYDYGMDEDLFRCLRQLLDDSAMRLRLSAAAYHTVSEQWSAETAAARLVMLCKAVAEGSELPDFNGGPLSRI